MSRAIGREARFAGWSDGNSDTHLRKEHPFNLTDVLYVVSWLYVDDIVP